MLKKSRSSCNSMSLFCILRLLIVCLVPGSWGQRQNNPEEEQHTAAAQLPEKHTICYQEGCYAVFLQKKVFREAGQACREHGGTLATMHTYEAAGVVHKLMSAIHPQGSRSQFRVWIGLYRAPRQCSTTRPLRGFVWVTGKVSSFDFSADIKTLLFNHFFLVCFAHVKPPDNTETNTGMQQTNGAVSLSLEIIRLAATDYFFCVIRHYNPNKM